MHLKKFTAVAAAFYNSLLNLFIVPPDGISSWIARPIWNPYITQTFCWTDEETRERTSNTFVWGKL